MQMNKTLTLATLALAFALGANAQTKTKKSVPTAADYANFANTKTMVILDDNMFSDFNMAIKDDMKNEWKPTEYVFGKRADLDKKMGDTQYSFLTTTTVTYPEDKVKAKYTYFSLVMGKPKTKLTDLPDLISIPLSYDNITEQKYVYKLPALIRFMLAHVEAMKADPSKISENPLLGYHKEARSLKNKTLYLLKSELGKDIQTEAAIKKVYPYKFKLVTEDDIRKAIEERNPDVVFLHKVSPEKLATKTRCYKLLMGAANSEIYFFDYHNINSKNPDCLRAEDLKKIK